MLDAGAKPTPQENLKRFDRAMLLGVLGLPAIGMLTLAQGLLQHQTFSVWMGRLLAVLDRGCRTHLAAGTSRTRSQAIQMTVA